ncbi:unnamed protein product [Mytilus coruscus]|uniref:Integrase catalytic domain-containing protein n=1 Tax=Mytilus coruscus TaxID=42192 RepID=A0A6J8BLC6_MYTCO|nr:unnamed protein product [Mytilus coruscus]
MRKDLIVFLVFFFQHFLTCPPVATNVLRISQRWAAVEELFDMLIELIGAVEELKGSEKDLAYKMVKIKDGNRGRPVYDITKDQLEYLVDLSFTGTEMAKLLQVSHSTIKRRLRFYGLSTTKQYSSICDDDLDQLLQPIIEENPHLGYRSIQARLKVCGHFCPETRVRAALVRLDPAAVAMRWCDTVQRRKYRVAGPNSLWHIDGNHKLIRWRFVVHGGIDGFSRLIVFLTISTNNKSATVLQSFLTAVQKYGLPSRVRTDHGTENVDVATFMTLQRGPYRGSVLQGKSVHN